VRRELVLAVLAALGAFVAALAGVALLLQILLASAPGDAADLISDDPVLRAALVEAWRLDEPVLSRWLAWTVDAMGGDLGESLTYRPGQAVTELVLPALARSLVLVGGALVLSLTGGLGLAWWTAGRRSATRRLVQALSVTPVFLLAWLLMAGLNEAAFGLMEGGQIARPAWFALPDEDSWLKTLLAISVLAVGSSALGEIHAALEDELLRIQRASFVEALRVRGVALGPHLLRALLAPLATIAGGRASFFVGGLVVVETVLHVGGLGSLLWQACRLRDYPLALGIGVVAGALVCGARLASDVARITVDPRLSRAP